MRRLEKQILVIGFILLAGIGAGYLLRNRNSLERQKISAKSPHEVTRFFYDYLIEHRKEKDLLKTFQIKRLTVPDFYKNKQADQLESIFCAKTMSPDYRLGELVINNTQATVEVRDKNSSWRDPILVDFLFIDGTWKIEKINCPID
ncbi:MAG: hypothetical protein ABIC19_01320 [Patescibacteria group bacterium]